MSKIDHKASLEAVKRLYGTAEFYSICGMLCEIFPRVAETRELCDMKKIWVVKKPFDTFEHLTEDGKLVYNSLYFNAKTKEGKK